MSATTNCGKCGQGSSFAYDGYCYRCLELLVSADKRALSRDTSEDALLDAISDQEGRVCEAAKAYTEASTRLGQSLNNGVPDRARFTESIRLQSELYKAVDKLVELEGELKAD